MNRETIKFSNPLPLAVALCALLLGCTNTGVRDEIQGAPDSTLLCGHVRDRCSIFIIWLHTENFLRKNGMVTEKVH
jgi:hypothetical protein